MDGSKIAKFVNVFSLESFPLYGRLDYLNVFCLSECLDFGAGQRGSDSRGWTVQVALALCVDKSLHTCRSQP